MPAHVLQNSLLGYKSIGFDTGPERITETTILSLPNPFAWCEIPERTVEQLQELSSGIDIPVARTKVIKTARLCILIVGLRRFRLKKN